MQDEQHFGRTRHVEYVVDLRVDAWDRPDHHFCGRWPIFVAAQPAHPQTRGWVLIRVPLRRAGHWFLNVLLNGCDHNIPTFVFNNDVTYPQLM